MQPSRIRTPSLGADRERERQKRVLTGGTLLLGITLVVLFWPGEQAFGHVISRQECSEGSQFILNAALSRDNGEPREAYLTQLRGDLQSIRAFPPALRWFAQDEADEALLLSAATDVFDDPQPPDRHRQAFLERCLGSPAHNS